MPSTPIWRDHRFRLIWIGQTASIFGDCVTGIALLWLLLLQTHLAFDAGLISTMRSIPRVTLGLVNGCSIKSYNCNSPLQQLLWQHLPDESFIFRALHPLTSQPNTD